MLKAFLRVLGPDAPVMHRYLLLALAYALLCSLGLLLQVPLLTALLRGNIAAAGYGLLAMLAAVGLCWYLRLRVERAGIRVGVALLHGGRHRIGEHVVTLPIGWFTPQHTAGLGHLVTNSIMSLAQLPAHVFTPVIGALLTPVVVAAALLWLDGGLGLAALLALPLLAGVLLLSTRLARQADRSYQQVFADASQRMLEFAHAQAVLRAFNGEGGGVRLLQQVLGQQRQAGARLIGLSALTAVCHGGLLQLLFVALLMLAVPGLLAGQGAAAGLAAIMALLLTARFVEPLQELAGYGEVLRSAGEQLGSLDALLAQPSLAQQGGPAQVQGASLALHDVDFRYRQQGVAALQGVSLQVAAGSMTALIGASGSGKSSVLKLLARFFDAQQGQVCIGGVDVRRLSPQQLASQVSFVFQDTYLFSGSIADNIRMGKPDATDVELRAAAAQAGLDGMLARLPQGLSTPVGEGGACLSGGERQRVVIARALIRQTPILLVDEATSALDVEHQAVITGLLSRLRGQRTLLVISHQLATVAMADQIVVLEQGRVVESGPPAVLAAAQGHYARFMALAVAAQGWRMAPSMPGSTG